MTKILRKAIMFRSQLKSKFIKSRNNEDWSNYKKQRNFCKNLLKKSKQYYFGQLHMKYLNDSRKLWKIIKPVFLDKGMNFNKAMIIEKDKLLAEEGSIAEVITTILLIYQKSKFEGLFWIKRRQCSNCGYSLNNVLYEDHASVAIIREKNTDNGEFVSNQSQLMNSKR